MAPSVALARGWERQLDRKANAVFYEGELTAERYHAWLRDTAVSHVALPDAPLDPTRRAGGGADPRRAALPARGLARRALGALRRARSRRRSGDARRARLVRVAARAS